MPLTSYSKLLKIHRRQPAKTKYSPSFSDLPSEIILNVFKSTDNFSAATTLSSISRQFNTMWRLNINSISKAILGHMFEAHEEGLALVTALEAASDELFDIEPLDPIKRAANQDTVSGAIACIDISSQMLRSPCWCSSSMRSMWFPSIQTSLKDWTLKSAFTSSNPTTSYFSMLYTITQAYQVLSIKSQTGCSP